MRRDPIGSSSCSPYLECDAQPSHQESLCEDISHISANNLLTLVDKGSCRFVLSPLFQIVLSLTRARCLLQQFCGINVNFISSIDSRIEN